MTPVRRRFLDIARDVAEAGMHSPAKYLDLIAPRSVERFPVRQHEMGRMSGCALTVRGIWRRLGVGHPRLIMPYEDQCAVSDLMAIGRQANAITWVKSALPLLDPGDVVLVAHPEHVWCALESSGEGWPSLDTYLIKGLDGGQVDDAKYQCIKVKLHEINGSPPRDGGRVVQAVIDLDRVYDRFGGVK